MSKICKKYQVIIIDPPWPMKKIVRRCAPNQTEDLDYNTLSIEDIKNIDILNNIKDPVGSHLWLWTTNKFLPDAFEVLKSWNARYICTFNWHKNGGFQPFNLPMYNNEFALYARIGNPPKFTDLKNFKTSFNGQRGKHSEKPSEFYAMIKDKTSNMNRIDIFNRRKIKGFDGWGDESPYKLIK